MNIIAKRGVLLVLAVAAITTSVLAIYSCNFFSYRELEISEKNDDGPGTKMVVTASSEEILQAMEPVVSYDPFEYLPEAGVGLFSYYMGDPSDKGVIFLNDNMCFYYCDEYTDYQWLSSNTNKTGHGNIDVWLAARYCSILAPIFGGLATLSICLSHIRGYKGKTHVYRVTSILLSIAMVLQFGTFAVLFSPPIMSSTSPKDQRQQFCFSATSRVQCRIAPGAMLSLFSAIAYMALAAFVSVTRDTTGNMKDSQKHGVSDNDTESDDDSDKNEIIRTASNEEGGSDSQVQHGESYESC